MMTEWNEWVATTQKAVCPAAAGPAPLTPPPPAPRARRRNFAANRTTPPEKKLDDFIFTKQKILYNKSLKSDNLGMQCRFSRLDFLHVWSLIEARHKAL